MVLTHLRTALRARQYSAFVPDVMVI